MRATPLQQVRGRILNLIWALFWMTLPVTSFPFFPGDIGGKTLVRPLAIYPLIVLVVWVTLPRLIKKPLPKTYLPLAAFAIVALVSSAIALTSGVSGTLGISVFDRVARNLLTLAIGIAFYLSVSLYYQTWKTLRSALRWLMIGFSLALTWGSLQIIYIVNFSQTYFDWLNKIQAFISTRKLFTTRISGMTYEPKWYAEQISFLLLPWLIGMVLTKQSLFRWRYKWLTVESILLVWGIVVVIFTYSRSGMLMLGILAFTSILMLSQDIRKRRSRQSNPIPKWLTPVVALGAMLAVLIVFFIFGANNRYFSRFWRYWGSEGPQNKTFLEYIGVNQRLVYVVTALNIYESSPIIGVGLGNYAFYFDSNLPNESYHRSPEILRQLTPDEDRDRLITPKNLFARLIAETGLIGAVTFGTFCLAVFGCSLFLWLSPEDEYKYWGISGLLIFSVFLITTFSSDSFAVPNMWVNFGLLTAAAHLPDGIKGKIPPAMVGTQ